MNRFAATALVLTTVVVALSGEDTPAKLREANLAWDRGDYPTALKSYLDILDGRPADVFADAIAEQTGEVFRTLELTRNGGAPRFSPAGDLFSYEVGRGVSRRTRLAALDAPGTAIA